MLLLTWSYGRLLKPTRDIVFRHPQYGLLLKRIVSVSCEDRCCRVAGIHRESIDATALGSVDFASIMGVVIRRIRLKRKIQRSSY